MATVELAIGLITCVLLLGTLASVVMVGVAQSAIQAVSADLARSLARDDQKLADQVRQRAPAGAAVDVARQPEGVEVTTRLDYSLFRLGEIPLTATAWAPWEPGVEP